jgi:hypothetical protein
VAKPILKSFCNGVTPFQHQAFAFLAGNQAVTCFKFNALRSATGITNRPWAPTLISLLESLIAMPVLQCHIFQSVAHNDVCLPN